MAIAPLQFPSTVPSAPSPVRGLPRWAEFLLVGGATFPLLALAWIVERTWQLDYAEYAVSYFAFYLAYVINDPHFAVTYLLFYRDIKGRAFGPAFSPLQRARYWAAGLLMPLLLIGWAAWAIAKSEPQVLGAMVQLMYLLVGWHYVKQGFGVVSVLCMRRGVKISTWERRALIAHCYLGWAFAWASPAQGSIDYIEKGVVYTGIAHPRWLELGCGVAFAISSGALAFVLVLKLWNERGRFPFAPVLGFLVTVWAWTIYSSFNPLLRYLIPGLHSIQYLFFVYLLRRNRARAYEGPPWFGRPAWIQLGTLALASLGLGWFLFHGFPSFLDDAFTPKASADTNLGPTPYLAAVFVFINVHHYCMDAVLWRRDNPETRWLSDSAKPA